MNGMEVLGWLIIAGGLWVWASIAFNGVTWVWLWLLCKIQPPHDWMDFPCFCKVCEFRRSKKIEPCHYGCSKCDDFMKPKKIPRAKLLKR